MHIANLEGTFDVPGNFNLSSMVTADQWSLNFSNLFSLPSVWEIELCLNSFIQSKGTSLYISNFNSFKLCLIRNFSKNNFVTRLQHLPPELMQKPGVKITSTIQNCMRLCSRITWYPNENFYIPFYSTFSKLLKFSQIYSPQTSIFTQWGLTKNFMLQTSENNSEKRRKTLSYLCYSAKSSGELQGLGFKG